MLKKIILLLCLLLSSCRDNPVAPTDTSKPGSRNYVWIRDSVYVPMTIFKRIWGSSSQDVWITGPGGDYDKTIFHYDGKMWSTDSVPRPIDPISIFGTSNDNIWLGVRQGSIWKFDGHIWKENYKYSIPGFQHTGLEDIYGINGFPIYAVGYADSINLQGNILFRKGTMLRYMSKWELIQIPELFYSFVQISYSKPEEIFLVGFDPSTYKNAVFVFDGKDFVKIIEDDKACAIRSFGQETYIVHNQDIYLYKDGLSPFLKIDLSTFGYNLWGRSSKDIFLRMRDGIAHFNGSGIEYLFHLNSNETIIGGLVLEDSAFFLIMDRTTHYHIIIRGKCNK